MEEPWSGAVKSAASAARCGFESFAWASLLRLSCFPLSEQQAHVPCYVDAAAVVRALTSPNFVV